MKNSKINLWESPLFWPVKFKDRSLWVLDETRIPRDLAYIHVRDTKDAVLVIRRMQTRAFGQFLVVCCTFLLEINRHKNASGKALLSVLQKTAHALNQSRPTFPFHEVTGLIMHWAGQSHTQGQDVGKTLSHQIQGYLDAVRNSRFKRVKDIAKIFKNGDSVLTHCNVSGELAMATAICRRQGRNLQFFVTETRPYFQGTKLTSWELRRAGADVVLICDNAVGSVIKDGLVNKIVVGSDRNCANGDFANKIGTYQIAVLAKEFKIPFYVLTQPSVKVKRGRDIPIELRDEDEILTFKGRRLFPKNVRGFYPAFDVVPREFVTGEIALEL